MFNDNHVIFVPAKAKKLNSKISKDCTETKIEESQVCPVIHSSLRHSTRYVSFVFQGPVYSTGTRAMSKPDPTWPLSCLGQQWFFPSAPHQDRILRLHPTWPLSNMWPSDHLLFPGTFCSLGCHDLFCPRCLLTSLAASSLFLPLLGLQSRLPCGLVLGHFLHPDSLPGCFLVVPWHQISSPYC